MELITLNSDNCKEYTTKELEAILELDSDFDLDVLFSEDYQEEKEEIKLTDFQILTLKCLSEAKAELAKWESKSYKENKNTVFVGSEMGGQNFSIGYINERRKELSIKNAQSDIDVYTKDLEKSGYKF